MSFFIGFASGIVFILVILPLFSKILVKMAMKKQMNNLLGSISNTGEEFSKLINIDKEEVKEDDARKSSFSKQ